MRAAAVIAFLAAVALAESSSSRAALVEEAAAPVPPVAEADLTGTLVGLEDDASAIQSRGDAAHDVPARGRPHSVPAEVGSHRPRPPC